MVKFNKAFTGILAAAMCFTFAACGESSDSGNGGNDDKISVDAVVYDGLELHYQSSDSGLADFLNDFSHRNLRYDDDAVGTTTVGAGTGYFKNWETMSLTWHNSSAAALGEDKVARLYNALTSQSSGSNQDGLGMIYNTGNNRESADIEAGAAGIPQGWPFPYWKYSVDDPMTEFNDLSVHGSTTFEFNDTTSKQNQGWTAKNGTFVINGSMYVADFKSNCEAGEDFEFYKANMGAMLAKHGGINTKYSPFLEIDMKLTTATNVGDYYIIWQTQAGGDTWYEVAHNDLVTTRKNMYSGYTDRCYIDMAQNENWDNQIVTALGIKFKPQNTAKKMVVNGNVNYIRCSYDTRQSNATYQWILALYNWAQYTNDVDSLVKLMPAARKATLFLTHALQGEKGLLDISYFYGHNGVGISKNADGSYNVDSANGVGNGYWDIVASPEKNLEANIYFYQALTAMAGLEKMVTDAGKTVSGTSTVYNRDLASKETVTYNYTAETLLELAEKVKTNIEKPVQVEERTATTASGLKYDNAGGFWNPTTGRFVSGINERTGEIVDYGFVYWNEEAICAGLGTDEQQKLIMQWINGDRTVVGDDSTGSDIYFYEFAPRFNTTDCTAQFSFCGYKIAESLIKKYDTTWPRQVQNGGADMCWAYYDIVARAKVLGADNALARLSGMQKWYEKVAKAADEAGYTGTRFYEAYYEAMEGDSEFNDGIEGLYKLQRAESNGPGSVGLDAEFIESVLPIRSVPDTIFGMQSTDYNGISFTNNLPEALAWFQIDNMKFANSVYSLRATKNGLEILNLKGSKNANNYILLNFKKPMGNYSVYVNGEKTNDYTEKDGIVTVKVKFEAVKVTVG